MVEQWTFSRDGDRESGTVAGRQAIPLSKKLNPIWWFGNDPEPTPPPDYMPGSSWRNILWYIRNPLVNFNDYVIGLCDKDYTVTGLFPVMTHDWLDLGKEGFKWSLIKRGIPRPFLSYTGIVRSSLGGKRILWHIGWGPGGSLMVKFNLTRNTPA